MSLILSTLIPSGRHRRILSFIGCFAAGVFLGACIMHMVADALGDIQAELQKRQQQVSAGIKGPLRTPCLQEFDVLGI